MFRASKFYRTQDPYCLLDAFAGVDEAGEASIHAGRIPGHIMRQYTVIKSWELELGAALCARLGLAGLCWLGCERENDSWKLRAGSWELAGGAGDWSGAGFSAGATASPLCHKIL